MGVPPMMMTVARRHDGPVSRIVPPELYLRASFRVLRLARFLFKAGLIGPLGPGLAVSWSNRLTEIGIVAWRARRRRLLG